MNGRRPLWVFALLAACVVPACGSVGSDGGRSGTGISVLRGDVVAAPGTALDVSNIGVSLSTADLSTRTDAEGRFELSGTVSGAADLRFQRSSDGLFARVSIVIPAGGVLQLSQVVIDPSSNEARPTQQRVQFEGVVTTLDCAGGAVRVRPKDDDPQATIFSIDVATATIRRDTTVLACGDLRVDDRLQVDGTTLDGTTLIDADLRVEGDGDDDEGGARLRFDGVVHALDCSGGIIRVARNDAAATVFSVETATATIRHGSIRLACTDLRVSDRVLVEADNPTGTILVNADISLEPGDDGGNDDVTHVQFEGFVASLDCPANVIRVSPKDRPSTIFTVQVATARIRHGVLILACGDLRAGDRVQVDADTPDGTTLVNAEIVFDPDDDGSDGDGDGETHVQFEGFVTALHCAQGSVSVVRKDDAARSFTVEVATATFRRGTAAIACGALRVGDRVQVDADTADGTTLVNAVIVVEEGADGDGDDGDTAIQFEGRVTALDCARGTFSVAPKEDPSNVFTVDVASATIRRGAAVIACNDLQVGDRVQVEAATSDGTRLIDADILLEEGEENGDNTERMTTGR